MTVGARIFEVIGSLLLMLFPFELIIKFIFQTSLYGQLMYGVHWVSDKLTLFEGTFVIEQYSGSTKYVWIMLIYILKTLIDRIELDISGGVLVVSRYIFFILWYGWLVVLLVRFAGSQESILIQLAYFDIILSLILRVYLACVNGGTQQLWGDIKNLPQLNIGVNTIFMLSLFIFYLYGSIGLLPGVIPNLSPIVADFHPIAQVSNSTPSASLDLMKVKPIENIIHSPTHTQVSITKIQYDDDMKKIMLVATVCSVVKIIIYIIETVSKP